MQAQFAALVGRARPRTWVDLVAYPSEFVARFSGWEPYRLNRMCPPSAKAECERGFSVRLDTKALRGPVAWLHSENRLP